MSKEKVGFQWKKHILVVQIYTTFVAAIGLARLCFLEMPTHAFGEAIIKTLKINNLFI